jgi:malate dehydrogenase (oxaloacetate-decarboxylating)(NADP+)
MLRSSSALKERMGIPVFHDDQHGTAIVVARRHQRAALVGKRIEDVKLVTATAPARRRWPAWTCW